MFNIVCMEESKREGRPTIVREEFVYCVQAVVGKKKFLIQF